MELDKNTNECDLSLKRLIDTLKNSKNNDFGEFIKSEDVTETEIKAFNMIRKVKFDDKYEKNINEFKSLDLKRLNFKYNEKYLLTEAVYYEKLNIVKYLAEDKGADLSVIDKYGRNLFQLALLYNTDTDIADYLLTKHKFEGVESLIELTKDNLNKLDANRINEQDKSGSTILHYILARGSVKLFIKLNIKSIAEESKIDFSLTDKEGFTCMDRAAANGHVDLLKELQKILKFQTDYSDPIAKSILYKALEHSPNDHVLEWWFENIQILTPEQVVSIIFQVNGRTSDALYDKLNFLSDRYDLNILDIEKNNVLMNLAKQVHGVINLNVFNKLVGENDNQEYLNTENDDRQLAAHIAAINGNLEIVDYYNLWYDNIQKPDRYNYTCYMYAIKHGYVDILKILPDKLPDDVVLTLLNVAMINKRNEIFITIKEEYGGVPEFKIDLSQNVNKEETHASRLLNIVKYSEEHLTDRNVLILNAFKNCNLECFKKMKNSFLSYTDDANAKAIHLLALFGRNDIILWYHQNKYDIKLTDGNGYTALHYAAQSNQIETIFLFFVFGLNYLNDLDMESTLFNVSIPIPSIMDKFNINYHINALASFDSLKNILQMVNADTLDNLIKLKKFHSNFASTPQAIKPEKLPEILIVDVLGELSANQLIVEYQNTKNDDGKYKIGTLVHSKDSQDIKSESLNPISNFSIEELKIHLGGLKKSEILFYDGNENFLLFINNIDKNTGQVLNIYFHESDKDEFIIGGSINLEQEWDQELQARFLHDEKLLICQHINKTEAIEIIEYIIKNNILSKTLIKTIKRKDFKFNLEYVNHLLTSNKRFMGFFKTKCQYIYFLDLHKEEEKPFEIDFEDDIYDVALVDNNCDILVQAKGYIEYINVINEEKEYKINSRKRLLTNPSCLDSLILFKNGNFVMSFNDHIDIFKFDKLLKSDDNSEACQRINLDQQILQSQILITNDNNYLLYITKDINKAKRANMLHIVELATMQEVKLNEESDCMKYFKNIFEMKNNLVFLTNKSLPYILQHAFYGDIENNFTSTKKKLRLVSK